MRVAVSGARGFVGQRLVARLAGAGALPIPLVRAPLAGAAPSAPRAHVIGDLTDDGEIDLPLAEALVHLASRVHVMTERAADPLAAYRRVNVHGTRRLLRAAHRAGVRRFVFASTIKVLGEETDPGAPFRQDSPSCPLDPYSVSKLEAEELVAGFCRAHAMEWSIVRPVLVYGPGVKGNFAQLLTIAGKQLPLPFASIENARSLVYVDNLAAFLAEAICRPELAGRAINLADEAPVSTPQLIRALAEAMGRRARLLPAPPRLLELGAAMIGRGETMRRLTRSLQVDTEDLFREMRWRPPVSWEAALRETTADVLRRR